MPMRTNDGHELHAQHPADIVRELHKISFTPAESDRAFMRETSARVRLQFNRNVCSEDAERFVADLVALGLLVEE